MMMTGDIRYKVNGMIKKKENRQKAINLIIPVKKKKLTNQLLIFADKKKI